MENDVLSQDERLRYACVVHLELIFRGILSHIIAVVKDRISRTDIYPFSPRPNRVRTLNFSHSLSLSL